MPLVRIAEKCFFSLEVSWLFTLENDVWLFKFLCFPAALVNKLIK